MHAFNVSAMKHGLLIKINKLRKFMGKSYDFPSNVKSNIHSELWDRSVQYIT